MPDENLPRRGRPVPPSEGGDQVIISRRALERAQAGQLELVAAAVRNVGPARTLAAVAGLEEGRPIAQVLKRLRELVAEETGEVFQRDPQRQPRQLQATVTVACHHYRFAAAQLLSALTGAGVVIPTTVAEALSLVEGWVAEQVPPPDA